MNSFGDLFFAATGNQAYRYQTRLAECLEWPDALEVPTGAGKTAAVILGWLWRRRFAPENIRQRTGRRLVVCLPMRSLTSQTAHAASCWLNRLQLPSPPRVHVVMGGAVDDDWLGEPDRDTVIVGTQDLLLSRALNRGFAQDRFQWPMAFGLLHGDVQWVFDEVQLMGVGATSSAQLDAFRRIMGAPMPHHSMWMTATLDEGRLRTVDRRAAVVARFQLTDDERDQLQPLLKAPKAVERLTVDSTDLSAVSTLVARLHLTGTRTIVIVNTVKRAQALFEHLRKTMGVDATALLHSRFRPRDRVRIEERVLQPEWAGVLVATQVLEAGVDVSCRTLVSDLAPWPSMVQRFGRCNRRGEFTDASIRWLDLTGDATAPYDPADLTAARDRLDSLRDGSPDTLGRLPVRDGAPVLPVVRRRDVIDLFDTSPDLAGADLDVSPFVRDGDETDVYVAWRSWDASNNEPSPDEPAPIRDEKCAVPIGAAREFLRRLNASRTHAAWRFDHRVEQWVRVERIVPGHLWLVPSSAGGYSAEYGFHLTEASAVPPIGDVGPAPEGYGGDPRSLARHDETLLEHTSQVVAALEAILAATESTTPEERSALMLAARWHDAGKAHPVFQRTMYGEDPDGRPPRAKSALRRRHDRPGFRHELVSALQMLATPAEHPFLAVYLVAAHHGRARLTVRARPTETPPPKGGRAVLGVWDHDSVPAAALGDGVFASSFVVDTAVFALGGTGEAPSWSARAAQLRDTLGPFRLAYLEALLRAADWRASANGSNVQ